MSGCGWCERQEWWWRGKVGKRAEKTSPSAELCLRRSEVVLLVTGKGRVTQLCLMVEALDRQGGEAGPGTGMPTLGATCIGMPFCLTLNRGVVSCSTLFGPLLKAPVQKGVKGSQAFWMPGGLIIHVLHWFCLCVQAARGIRSNLQYKLGVVISAQEDRI
eukprot:scaffold321689_cov15-Tisochrysis_lutea.AAC.1